MLKHLHYPLEIMLQCVRWYLASNLSLRNLEEMMPERGVDVDHSNIQRWIVKLTPVLEASFRKIAGKHRYLYRAVDKHGKTVDFLPTAKRDGKAALRFLTRTIKSHGVPWVLTIDKSGANTASIEAYNAEQDHRRIKPRIRPMLGFQTPRSASIILGGIEFIHMLHKGKSRNHGRYS